MFKHVKTKNVLLVVKALIKKAQSSHINQYLLFSSHFNQLSVILTNFNQLPKVL